MANVLSGRLVDQRLPQEFYEVADQEVVEALGAIGGKYAVKKRTSVIMLAYARATQQALAQVFRLETVCCERVWYSKWRKDPAIIRAYTLLLDRLVNYVDLETVRVQEFYRSMFLRNLAQYRADAPTALLAVMTDPNARPEARIDAAVKLIQFGDPQGAGQIAMPGRAGVDVSIEFGAELDQAIQAEMRRLGIVPGVLEETAGEPTGVVDGDGDPADSAG
jgi:hypothetical protein